MAKIKSLKEFLDWVAHGKLLVELAFAFAPGEPNVESSCGASSNVRLGGLF